MKKHLLLLLGLLFTGISAYAQGQVNFAARVVGIYDAPVFVCYPVKAAGDRYLAQLYAGPTQTSLAPVGDPLPFLTGADSGYWAATKVTINRVNADGFAFAQVRVWDTAYGPTYEAVAPNGGLGFGFSSMLAVRPTVAPDSPATLIGLQSFTFILPIGGDLCAIPEPSIVLLAVLGSFAFLFRRGDNFFTSFVNFAKRKNEQKETKRTKNLILSVSSVCSCKNMNRSGIYDARHEITLYKRRTVDTLVPINSIFYAHFNFTAIHCRDAGDLLRGLRGSGTETRSRDQ